METNFVQDSYYVKNLKELQILCYAFASGLSKDLPKDIEIGG